MEQLIIAVLDRIDNELQRCYWNKNQKHLNSPFANTGETYSNDVFTVRAYSWADDEDNEEEYQKPNFESEHLVCHWYKHAHRGLSFKLKGIDSIEQLGNFLDECIHSIRKDFGEPV